MTSPKCSPHGWTVDTLAEYLGSRIDSQAELLKTQIAGVEKNVTTANMAAERAIAKSDEAISKRLDAMNEFRAALSDQANLFMPRSEYTMQHGSLVEKINSVDGRLTERVAALESSSEGKSQGMGIIGSVILGALFGIGALSALADLIIHMASR